MKTFRKKMISLMLVALMLISAMPFAAFADETETTEVPEIAEVAEGNVEEIITNYNESGNDDYEADYQDNGVMAISALLRVVRDDGTVLVSESVGKRYKIMNDFSYISGDTASEKIAKAALSASGLKNSGAYDISNVDLQGTILEITVTPKTGHDCGKYIGKAQEVPGDDAEHEYVCSVCGGKARVAHTYKVSSKNADYHVEKCSVCGYTKNVTHANSQFYQSIPSSVTKGTVMNDGSGTTEDFTVIAAARDATCTKRAAYAKIQYGCGYTIGGEEHGDLDAHDYDSADVCRMCGRKKDGEQTYNVEINVTNGTTNPIITGEVYLTKTEVQNLGSDYSKVLKKMVYSTSSDPEGDRVAVNAYMEKPYFFLNMSVAGTNIVILVNADLRPGNDSTINGTSGYILIIDGKQSYYRNLTVGRFYFDEIQMVDKNRDLVAMKITDSNQSTRTIYKGSISNDARVQADDVACELIWDANIVTLKFYRHAGGGAMLLETRQIRAGETIDSLPMLDGKVVNWYLPSGEPLQEGRVYDFKDTTVNVYPKTSSGSGSVGDVYLLVYKNGDTKTAVDATPINITQYMQANGLISRADLKKVIESKAKGEKIYLFDYEGWEDYKDTKDTRSDADVFSIGTSSDRGNVFLYAMVTGVSTSSSSSKADGSNPKTGDNAQLGTAAAVMTVAVIGLGATTVVLKKKEII